MEIWQKGRVPPQYWDDIRNQRQFLNWLAEKHGVSRLDDWYSVPADAFPQALLKKYGAYHCKLLATHFPRHDWAEWRFRRTPKHFWAERQNRRRYFEWLGKHLRYRSHEDWYSLHGDDIRNNHGAGLLTSYYRNSYADALLDVFPEHEWEPWRFRTTPDGFWSKKANRLRYLRWLGQRLGYQTLDDWYSLSYQQLTDHNGLALLKAIGSVAGVVKLLFPTEELLEWQFATVPRRFWRSHANRKRYFQWLGKQLGFEQPDDWYRVTAEDFATHNGSGLLYLYYGNSPSVAVAKTFPEHKWLEWKFTSAPNGFWRNTTNCRRYLKWLGDTLGLKNAADWYRISVQDFKDNHGWGLLQAYDSSPTKALTTLLPEYRLQISQFDTRPQSFWKDPKNQKAFLHDLFDRLGYKAPDDWYQLTFDDVAQSGGYGLLRQYNGSHIAAVMANFPRHDWAEWQFASVPQGFWADVSNRQRYFAWLGERLGIRKMDDWYRVNSHMIESNYGSGLKQLVFGGSPSRAIMETFPRHKWIPWKFEVVPNGFWHDKENRVAYLKWLGRRLGITKKSEWYEITKNRFVENFGGGFIDYYRNSCAFAITDCFDHMNWDIECFSVLRTNQKRIFRILKHKWSDAVWEYKHPDMRYSTSGRPMELDIWIARKKIAVEYQGEQHFFPVPGWGGEKAFAEIQRRDAEKRKRCDQLGIRLIEVPYTWDGDAKSLLALVAGKIRGGRLTVQQGMPSLAQ
jgi:hypothetical protein